MPLKQDHSHSAAEAEAIRFGPRDTGEIRTKRSQHLFHTNLDRRESPHDAASIRETGGGGGVERQKE